MARGPGVPRCWGRVESLPAAPGSWETGPHGPLPCGLHTEQGRLCRASGAGGRWGRAPLCALRPGAQGRGRVLRSRPAREKGGQCRGCGGESHGEEGRRRENRRKRGRRQKVVGPRKGRGEGRLPGDGGGGTAQALGSGTPAVTPTLQPSRSQKEAVHLRRRPRWATGGQGQGRAG